MTNLMCQVWSAGGGLFRYVVFTSAMVVVFFSPHFECREDAESDAKRWI